MVDQRKQHDAFCFIMPGLDHIQTEKARSKRLMVLNLARHKCICTGCMGSFRIAAARTAD